jgi:hypothetical protein
MTSAFSRGKSRIEVQKARGSLSFPVVIGTPSRIPQYPGKLSPH